MTVGDNSVIASGAVITMVLRGVSIAGAMMEQKLPGELPLPTALGVAHSVPPVIPLALDRGKRLQSVYPHVDGDEVNAIHDGIEALESMVELGDAEQMDDEQNDQQNLAVPPL